MKYAPKYGIQAGGDMRKWSNPERTFEYSLLKMDFECQADAHPGILVVTDPGYKKAVALAVVDLRKELPAILDRRPDGTLAYWRIVRDEEERNSILAGLTTQPVFNDILG